MAISTVELVVFTGERTID